MSSHDWNGGNRIRILGCWSWIHIYFIFQLSLFLAEKWVNHE
jgi:hypothetical protein